MKPQLWAFSLFAGDGEVLAIDGRAREEVLAEEGEGLGRELGREIVDRQEGAAPPRYCGSCCSSSR